MSNSQFENSLKELEAITAKLESGQLSLEESMEAFESGIKLTKKCQKSLEDAEEKLKKLGSETHHGNQS